MKTSNKILIYDDHCPLCAGYTDLFVKYNLLEAQNRVAFSTADASLLRNIDFEKAKNEIPLVDKDSGKVYYGLDALLVIIGQSFPIIQKTGQWKPLNWFLKKLYRFISFNRKVVVAKKCGKGEIDCSPDFNIFYRILLILFSFITGICVLPLVQRDILNSIPYYSASSGQLLAASLLLALITYLAAFTLSFQKAIEYLGQHSILCLLFILLIVPLLLASHYFSIPGWLVILYLLAEVTFLTKEYIRRMRYVARFAQEKWVIAINTISTVIFTGYLFFIS